MKIEELKDRITRLAALVEDPQPGLMSWHMVLGEQMEGLIKAAGAVMLTSHEAYALFRLWDGYQLEDVGITPEAEEILINKLKQGM